MSLKSTDRGLFENNGLTIIELVIAIALIAIIISPLSIMSIRGLNSYYREQERIELMESGQIALLRISRQIRLSEERLEIDEEEDSIEVESISDEYKYSLDGKVLYEEINGTKNMIAENIAVFDVELSDSQNLLSIDLKLEGSKYGETIDLKTSLYLRNQ